MLVSIDPRAELRLRIVEVDHDQPVEADAAIEVGQEPVGRVPGRTGRSRPPRHGRRRGRSRADPDRCRAPGRPRRCRPARRRSCRDRSRCPRRSRARSSAHRASGRPRPCTSASPSASRAIPAGTPAPRCDPTWTLTNRAANQGAARSSLASRPTDRPKKSSSGPARLTRYEAWMATGRMSSSIRRSRKAGPSAGGAARRRQAVGLSANTWSASAPISCARSTALTMPRPSGRWAPRRRPSGSIRGMVRRGCGATPWSGRSGAGGTSAAGTMRALVRSARGFDPSCSRHRRRVRSGRSRRRRADTGWPRARSRR